MFDLQNLAYIRSINSFEWAMLGIYFLLLVIPAFFYQSNKIRKDPLYRYYLPAILFKIGSSVVFCLIYIYYYHGGDTVSYYETSRALVNLGTTRPADYMHVITSSSTMENYLRFDNNTGYPWPYMYFDPQTFFVAKLLSPILLVSFRSYLVSSVMLSWVSFFGIWRFFRLICRYFPSLSRWFALSILFMPSALFWGSGILKDTFTFSAVCWFICGVEGALISRKKVVTNISIVLLSFYVLFSIKPYILIALFPGTLVWIFYSKITAFRSRFLRVAAIPLIYLISFGAGYGALSLMGNSLGKFSIDKMLKTAAITQNDLKQDYYNGSSFDIGSFQPTIKGVMSKVPVAVLVGFFRPYMWEARNIVMIASGLENSIYLILALVLVFRFVTDPFRFFRVFINNPILIFLFSYSFFFAAMVGLSTSNFGALVRFKIPFLSAFVTCLIILNAFLAPVKLKTSRRLPVSS